jgi:hypothetical protein
MADAWHVVEAQRDDGQTVMFRIRELVPRPELRTIFVVELPFETTELSRLPSAIAYRRLKGFEDGWLAPAADALGLAWVGVRIEDGSSFFYLYGNGEPNEVIARLAPFDAAIGFYDDTDPAWSEYATLRELLDAAKQKPTRPADEPAPAQRPRRRSARITKVPMPASTSRLRATGPARPPATPPSKKKPPRRK